MIDQTPYIGAHQYERGKHMSIMRYLSTLPQCWGDCNQGRRPCTSPDLCAGARAAMADASAECRAQLRVAGQVDAARRSMACTGVTTSPAELGHYWPWGEHSRPGKLTAADFERHEARKRPVSIKPAIFGPDEVGRLYRPAPTWWQRLRKWWLG